MTSRAIDEAQQLIAQGRTDAARSVLEHASATGDADAALVLGREYLTGRTWPRDLSRSRALFARAAALGDFAAASVLIAFAANGTGGKRDWPQCLALMRSHAGPDNDLAAQLALIEAMALDEDGAPTARPSGEPVPALPGASIFRGFLTAQECAWLISKAAPAMRPSVVVHPQTGERISDPIRTSDNAAFPLAREAPVIHAINRRIAAASRTDVAQGEPLQVLRYAPGQQYKLHLDALPHTTNQRNLTFLIYLNEQFEGGETEFPKRDFAFRGRAGDALLFRNANERGEPDPLAIHAGRPVTSGVKFLASRWIRAKPLDLA